MPTTGLYAVFASLCALAVGLLVLAWEVLACAVPSLPTITAAIRPYPTAASILTVAVALLVSLGAGVLTGHLLRQRDLEIDVPTVAVALLLGCLSGIVIGHKYTW